MTENTEHTTYSPPQAAPQGPPQAAPHRLTRPRDGRMLGGVCAGVARYTGVDVTVVRLVAVASLFFGLAGAVVYVAGLFLMPEE